MPSATSSPRPLRSLDAAHRFEAIGAPWRIDTAEPLEPEASAAIDERIEAFDRTYSRFRDDSLVSRIARESGVFEFPADAAPLFDLYRRLHDATRGAVSPLIGRTMETLGYDRDYTLRARPETARVPAWDDSFAWDGHAFHAARPTLIDVGAAGKGYLVDLVARVLHDRGIDDYLVDASGDMAHSGGQSLRIALEHPLDVTKAIGIAELKDRALCASAINRRAWGDGLHHVVDALTGLPTRRVIATWAIADTALLADGLATALFFADPAELRSVARFEWVRVLSTGRVEYSTDFEGEIFA